MSGIDKYLLDTNLLIYYLNGQLDQRQERFINSIINDDDWQTSVISKIEFLGFRFLESAHKQLAEELILSCKFLYVNDAIADQAIYLRQKNKLKTPDAIIAATAIVHNFVLVSRNDKDFEQIANIKYYNPF